MRSILRYITIALAAFLIGSVATPLTVALLTAFSLFDTQESILRLGLIGGIASAITWLTASFCLHDFRVQQWMILGFLSPFVGVPIFFLLTSYAAGAVSFTIALQAGVITAGMLCPLLCPVGLLSGWIISAVWRLIPSGA